MTIHNQKYRATPMSQKLAKKLHKTRGIQPSRVDGIPKGSMGIDRRNGIDLLPLATSLNNRGLSFRCPSPTQRRVRANTRFVEEEDIRATFFGALPQSRVVLSLPLFDRFGVSLVSSSERLLRSDAQLCQQASNRSQTQADGELLFDEGCYDLACPKTKVKAVLARVLAVYPLPHLLFLLLRKVRTGAGCFTSSQPFFALFPLRTKPPVDRSSTEAEAIDHFAWALTLADSPHCQQADRLQSIVRKCPAVDSHASILARNGDDV